MDTKICKTCGIEKNIVEFRPHHKSCRKCGAEYNKLYRENKKASESDDEKEIRILKHREYYRKRMSDPEIRAIKRQQQYENAVSNPVRHLFNRAKARAIKKGLEFNISKEDIIIPEKCPVFNTPLVPSNRQNNNPDNSPSLDRIDSTKGYIKGNVMVISYRANTLKNNSTPEEIKKLYEFYCKPTEES